MSFLMKLEFFEGLKEEGGNIKKKKKIPFAVKIILM